MCTGDWRKLAPPSFARLKLKRARSLLLWGRSGSQRAERCKAAAIAPPEVAARFKAKYNWELGSDTQYTTVLCITLAQRVMG